MDTVSTRTGPHVPQLKEMLATDIWGKTNKLHWSKITLHFLLVYLKLFLRLQLFTLVWNGKRIFSVFEETKIMAFANLVIRDNFWRNVVENPDPGDFKSFVILGKEVWDPDPEKSPELVLTCFHIG